MELLHTLPPFNFGGVEGSDFQKSRVVVLPVPYDGTASYKSGSRGGPRAIIDASRNMEWYDEELGFEPATAGIYTLEELEPDASGPEAMAARVEKAVDGILSSKKFPLILGGEHSVSAGAFRSLKRVFGEITILQFDAHPDLRDEFENSKYSHACVMRRAFDLGFKIVQVGIRSVCKEDHAFLEKNADRIKTFYASNKGEWKLEDIVSGCSENVYISFDVDAFDSALMPATGTPEPGGISWDGAIGIIRAVSRARRIVGADVVELLPTPGLHACDFLAAKLAYKIIGHAFRKK